MHHLLQSHRSTQSTTADAANEAALISMITAYADEPRHRCTATTEEL